MTDNKDYRLSVPCIPELDNDIRSDLTMRKALDLVKGAVKKSAKRSAKKTDDADAGQDGAEEKPAKKKSASKAKAVEEEK